MAEEEYDILYKIILVGDSGVGKTQIALRFIKNTFEESSMTTIGVEFSSKYITTKEGAKIRAQIWDTAGEEKYKSVTKAYYRGAVGAFIVYDITSSKSFENAEDWL